MTKKICVALAAATFFFSCSDEIPSDTLTHILYEMYLTDAVLGKRGFSPGDSVRVYEPIAEKYGYKLADVKKTLVKYATVEGKTQDLFNSLDNMIKAEKEKYIEAARLEKLASNFYSGADSIAVKSRTFNKQSINITLEEKGIYDISAKFLFMENDSTRNPKMTVWLESRDHADSVVNRREIALSKDSVFSAYSLRIHFDDPKFNQLRGYWLSFDESPSIKDKPAEKSVPLNLKRKPDDKYRSMQSKRKEEPYRQNYIMKEMNVRYNFAASDSVKTITPDSLQNNKTSPDSVKYTEMQIMISD